MESNTFLLHLATTTMQVVIVEQNDARSILGDLCAFTAYCEAHVRMHQGGSTVASIAGHRYDLLVWENISILQHFQLAAALLS